MRRDGVALEPVIHGGGQELDRRSGTHNVAGIVGMVAAMEAAAADRERFRAEVGEARDRFESRWLAAGRRVSRSPPGSPPDPAQPRADSRGSSAETLLILLDGLGLAGSAGSACHSGAIEVSHVLAAMGVGAAEAAECVRFSFGWTTRPEDGDTAAAMVLEALEGLL